MTWIRWECTTPTHELIGQLAEDLKVRRAEAHGLYVATCCGFGQHQADGSATAIPDTSLERWADWQGKPGRWAAAFRHRCLDDQGNVRGWWRNESALREQDRQRKRPGEGTRRRLAAGAADPDDTPAQAPEKPRDGTEKAPAGPTGAFPPYHRGNVDVDGNELRTTTTQSVGPEAEPPAPEGSDVAKLLTGMGRTVDRWAVFNFLERVPERDLKPWVARLAAYLEGVDLPPGMRPTPAQLATACRDYAGNFSAAHFRGFIRRVIEGPKSGDHRRGGEAARIDRTMAAVDRFVSGGADG